MKWTLRGKNSKKRQRRLLYHDKINSAKRYSHCKYIDTNTGAPKYIKQILLNLKVR